jgi:hypothetical protein
LRAAGLRVEEGEFSLEHVWNCDSLVGFMFSTSIASRRALGDKAGDFEAALRRALLDFDPSDHFVSRQRFSFTLGTKES